MSLRDVRAWLLRESTLETLQAMLDRGIEPDFVTSLDYHELSRRFFEDIPPTCRTHLIAEPKANWHVIDTYRGPTSLLNNRWARLCLGDALAARGGLKAGSTVAHLAFYLAAYMGCDPIVMVGQDLAYTDHVYYTPGTSMHDLRSRRSSHRRAGVATCICSRGRSCRKRNASCCAERSPRRARRSNA